MDNNLNNGTPVEGGSDPAANGIPPINNGMPIGNSTPVENNSTPAGNDYTSAGTQGGGILNGYMMNADPGYTQSFTGSGNSNPPQPPKKKKTVVGIAIAVAAIVLVGGGIAAFAFRNVLANTWARMTKSPEEYTQYVLEKNLIENDALWKGYEESYNQVADLKGVRISGETRLELSDEMIHKIEDTVTDFQNSRYSAFGGGMQYYDEYYDYLEDQWDQDNYDTLDYDEWEATYKPGDSDDSEPLVDLASLSNVALVYEFERGEEEAKAMQALQLADRDYLLTFNELYDSSKNELYVQIPEINKDYAKIEMEEFLDEDELETLNDMLFSSERLSAQMMEPKTARSIYNRYMNLLISKIDDVDEKEDAFEIAGEEQKCVMLSFTLDEERQKEILQELCQTVIDDSELRQYFVDYMKTNMPTEDPEEIWDEMVEELELKMEDIDDMEIDSDAEITLYVNNLGQIIGVRAEDGNQNSFLCGYIIKKGQLYAQMTFSQDRKDLLNMEGVGKLTTSGATADFTVYVDEVDEEFTFSVENLTPKGGVFVMDLKQFYDLAEDDIMDDEAKELIDLMKNATLRIESHSDGKKSNGAIAIVNDDDKVAALSWKLEVSDAGTIELPSSKETETIRDEDDLAEFVIDSDLGVFVDVLEELGMPKDTADELREEIEMMREYY